MDRQNNRNLHFQQIVLLFLTISNVKISWGSYLLPDPTTGVGYHKYHYKPSEDFSQGSHHRPPTAHDVNRSVAFGHDVIDRLRRLEESLQWSEIDLKRGTAAHGYSVNAMADQGALGRAKEAHVAARATLHLMGAACQRTRTTRKDCAHLLTSYTFHNTSLHQHCPKHSTLCTRATLGSAYRTLDGSCNNAQTPSLGAANTQYKRLLFPDYLDGVQEVRRSVLDKAVLPSARLVSARLAGRRRMGGEMVHQEEEEEVLSLAGMAWAQFVAHDLAHTVTNRMIHTGKSIDCCTPSGDSLLPRYLHPFCQPIEIPKNDAFYSKHGLSCMNYVRSLPALSSDCKFGPYEQLNQATHFLDASHVYGSDENKARSLRSFQNGQMASASINGRKLLPIIKNDQDCLDETCFSSGDNRVNFNPQSTAIYMIFTREHNRIAEILHTLNSSWTDEELYQMTRKIVIAEIQHITYEEWLPLIIGKKFIKKLGVSKYMENVDPSISNSFATAAFRFLKSLMKSNISLLEEDRGSNTTINIFKYLNDPSILEQPDYMDSILRSLTTQKSEKSDFSYSDDLTNSLYGRGNVGLDIVSIDIQRGRDHGLPSYTAFRAKCGLPRVNTFQELADFISLESIEALSEIYKSPKDVDILVGGMLEKSYSDSILGPTFSCIIADQMKRTMQGDRFFYTNTLQSEPFTPKQLESIKRLTLGKIICENSDGIKKMQRQVFKVPSIEEGNVLEDCNNLPGLDLSLWK